MGNFLKIVCRILRTHNFKIVTSKVTHLSGSQAAHSYDAQWEHNIKQWPDRIVKHTQKQHWIKTGGNDPIPGKKGEQAETETQCHCPHHLNNKYIFLWVKIRPVRQAVCRFANLPETRSKS
jgi:hypothetical protein